ncbi:MAG: hypothetical protein U0441_28095 [Polyangiaceae bacterium]
MRTWAGIRWLSVSGLFGIAIALGSNGCLDTADDCHATGSCTTETTTTTSTSDTTSTTTTTPPACLEFANGDVVSPTCGLFVSPATGSDMTGDGSQAKPFATLGKALAGAPESPIYVCAGALEEAVLVKGAAVIFGGFTCDAWSFTGDKPSLTAAADAIPLLVDDAASLTLSTFAITSAAAKTAGASSIAILARAGATLALTNVDVTAGNGADGADGQPFGAPADQGAMGMPGADGCAAAGAQNLGGEGGITMCDGKSTSGGLGGAGTKNSGGAGSEGDPGGGTGIGGAGAKVGGGGCATGGQGSDGMPGGQGSGAPATATLTSEGFQGASGASGMPGSAAQGGGGGGGAKVCANGNAGPGGGGGGAGGCGGKGGAPGAAGGSSIAVASVSAKAITITGGLLKSGKGGLGGAGGPGQDGGFGGGPGLAGGPGGACGGGQGGQGGAGGPGGGGAGGHSIGVAWTGAAPVVSGATFAHAAPGTGGAGGPGSDATATGAPGSANDTSEIP